MRRIKTLLRRGLDQTPLFRAWQTNREFRVERALLKARPISITDQTSVIHYSVNKAATQYTKRIMLSCGKENGLIPVRMSDYAWNKEFPYLFTLSAEEVKPYLHIFRPRGFLYTVFGGLVEGIPNIQDYRTVIMIRDPRDVLVSGYYSYSKSHAVPRSGSKAKEFQAFRDRINNKTVDEHVVEMSQNTRWRMQQYLELRRSCPAVCILRYEDMIADFTIWLEQLLAHCQWEISPSLRDQLLNEADWGRNIKQENTSSHRRQVTPGDYKRKLQTKTIDYLNEYLSDVLSEFGYR